MNRPTVILALLVAATASATAQDAAKQPSNWEVRVVSGGFMATGTARNELKDAQVSALQVARRVNEHFAIGTTLSWARSRAIAMPGTPKVDVLTADIGAEARTDSWHADRAVSIGSFAGMGVGTRGYNTRGIDETVAGTAAAYASIGTDIGLGRVGLRLEGRDYVTAHAAGARNDMTMLVAVRINRQYGNKE